MAAFIRCAVAEDVERLTSFLAEAKLNTDGLAESIDYFLIMENDQGNVKATLGIEPLGTRGLLRSLAMAKDMSENELFVLFEQILMLARDRKLQSLYLSSNKKTSLAFFQLLGFKEVNKLSLPQELYESDHVKHILTVDNSFFLTLSL
ncbi:GNAT family N-acetyltransferase [Bacillus sp. JJ1474]|uniref:GNAT family N-acetyltransferase n=1 Tax=Bacillus sp. JJ1474 TaxID=3122955 RepID=UPI002FFF3C64